MILVYYLLFINIIAFIMYGIDKAKAKADKWRIPEHTLIFLAVIGGAIGAGLGMKVFHHKTKKNKFRITVPVLLVIEIILIIFCLFQNYHLVVTNYSYENDKITDSLDGYRIVQISDLHNQFFGFGQKRLLSQIEKCEPDIIAVTGDVIDTNHTNYELAMEFFKGAAKIAPVYYITGNHELWLDNERFSGFLSDIQNMGVHYIDDTVVDMKDYLLIGVGDSTLRMGVDPDSFEYVEISDKGGENLLYPVGNNGTERDSSYRDDNRFKIMLAHEPSFHNVYQNCGMDLVFTGHYHGGQIIIPGKGGLISPDFEFFPELYEGMHEFGDTTMVISRGLGNSLAPVRINNYPEIVVVELKKSKADN